MDDGGFTKFGLKAPHSEGYTFGECYILAAMLHYPFGLICRIQKHGAKPLKHTVFESMTTFKISDFSPTPQT
jgi:hypothetical protein